MTKADLRTGMIVTLRNGDEYMVYRDYAATWTENGSYSSDCLVLTTGETGWRDLNNFANDLTSKSAHKSDIVKVEKVTHPLAFICPNYEKAERKVLWCRNEPRKYTHKQIEDILGHKFELVEED